MSKIYQPPAQPFDPLFVDCLENAMMREFLNFSTQSLTRVPVKAITIAPNLFHTPGIRLYIDVEGNFDSGGGNSIQLTTDFDASSDIPDLRITAGTFDTAGTPSIELMVKLYRRNTDLAIIYDAIIRPVQATNSIAQLLVKDTVLTGIDFSISHTLTLFADVNNAADVLSFGAISARVI